MAAETLNHCTAGDDEREHHQFWGSERWPGVRPSLFSLPVLALIQLYQETLSEQIQARQCRFNPTCSQYVYEAIAQYGLIVGGLLAYNRISRCNPSHPAGNDPVP